MPWNAQIFFAFPEQPSPFFHHPSPFFNVTMKIKNNRSSDTNFPARPSQSERILKHFLPHPRKGAGVVSFLLLVSISPKLSTARGASCSFHFVPIFTAVDCPVMAMPEQPARSEVPNLAVSSRAGLQSTSKFPGREAQGNRSLKD